MPNQFPTVKKSRYGYDPQQVNAFITMARDQYDHPEGYLIAADQIRETDFDLVKGGYDVQKVDSALDRIEDALADREISRKRETRGNHAVTDQLERVTEVVRGRLDRPKKHRFARAQWPTRGYNRKEVDRLCNLILEHLVNHEALAMSEVRRTVFSAQRGGYAENQVDAFIDRVIQILHIERNA